MSVPLAAVVDTGTLAKVVVWSLVAGIGITAIFALGVSSAAGMLDALRRRRSVLGGVLFLLTGLCLTACGGAVAVGLVVMARK